MNILLFICMVITIFFYLYSTIMHKRVLIQDQEFAINHLIKLDNVYRIKMDAEEKADGFNVRKFLLYENEKEIDPEIFQYKDFIFVQYFMGKNGYYIFNKMNKTLSVHKTINSFPTKQQKVFNRYFH